MDKSIDVFIQHSRDLVAKYPELCLVQNEDIVYIKGALHLLDNIGNKVDTYLIEIHPSPQYPLLFPNVRETGGQLPVNLEWHIYENTGDCCIRTFPEQLIFCLKGITLISFYEKEVIPYFYNQLHRKLYGYYVKERPHGPAGQIDYFIELFKTKDLKRIVNWLTLIAYAPYEPSRRSKCFCGSGEKYRRCHKEAFNTIKILPFETILYFANQLLK